MDWELLGSELLRMIIAGALALPLGWDREREERSAGLRTFPLVAVASCGYMLIARSFLAQSTDAQARVLEGLITGIGFVGGGAILKLGTSTRGTATAASIWSTGAIGVAVAYSRYEIGALLCVINFATLRGLTPLKANARDRDDTGEPRDEPS